MNTNYFDSYEDEQEYRRITGEEQSSRRLRSNTIKQHAEDTKHEAKRRDADEALSSAEQLERRRKEFKLEDLLPQQLASACKVMQKSLPVDTLSTLLPLLAGYSGLLKLGTRIAKSHDFHVPCNLYVGVVCISGGCKSPTKQRLIDDPAKDIKQDAKKHHLKNFKLWQEEHQ